MKERERVEKVIGRIYRNYVASTGRLPDGKTIRRVEERVKKVASIADNKNRKR